MTVADIDVWRSAGILVKEHGQSGAWVAAVTRIRELDGDGDTGGVTVWNRILDAVEELGRTVLGPDDRVQ